MPAAVDEAGNALRHQRLNLQRCVEEWLHPRFSQQLPRQQVHAVANAVHSEHTADELVRRIDKVAAVVVREVQHEALGGDDLVDQRGEDVAQVVAGHALVLHLILRREVDHRGVVFPQRDHGDVAQPLHRSAVGRDRQATARAGTFDDREDRVAHHLGILLHLYAHDAPIADDEVFADEFALRLALDMSERLEAVGVRAELTLLLVRGLARGFQQRGAPLRLEGLAALHCLVEAELLLARRAVLAAHHPRDATVLEQLEANVQRVFQLSEVVAIDAMSVAKVIHATRDVLAGPRPLHRRRARRHAFLDARADLRCLATGLGAELADLRFALLAKRIDRVAVPPIRVLELVEQRLDARVIASGGGGSSSSSTTGSSTTHSSSSSRRPLSTSTSRSSH